MLPNQRASSATLHRMSNAGLSFSSHGGRPTEDGSQVLTVSRAIAEGMEPTVVLVEGFSDRVALETLAARRGRDLADEKVYIVPMGGATNIGQFLDVFGPAGHDVRLVGLYDAAEEGAIKRGLVRAGLGENLTRLEMEQLGFFMCDVDLEDELIRGLGTAAVEEVIASQGELGSWRTFQNQPAHRGRSTAGQLRRFLGTRSGRKARYASLLVEVLDPERVPQPLDRVLALP
jgi:hypothetical protein